MIFSFKIDDSHPKIFILTPT